MSMVFFSPSVHAFPFRIAVLIVVFDILVFNRHSYFWRSGGRADRISRGESLVINEIRALRGDIREISRGESIVINEVRALRGDVREGFDRLCAEVALSARRFKFYFEDEIYSAFSAFQSTRHGRQRRQHAPAESDIHHI